MLVWNRPALLFVSLRLAAGAMGHGPEMFQTFNQQHNPLQKFGKIAKTYGALRQGLRWAPMGPDGPRWAPMGPDGPRWASRLKGLLLTGRLPTIYTLNHQISLLTLNRSVDSADRPLVCSRMHTPCIRTHHMVSPECRMSSTPTSETQSIQKSYY